MITILSIDFDVFCDTSLFLPGACCCHKNGWVVDYNQWQGEWRDTFKFQEKQYRECLNYIRELNQPVYISNSHHDIFDLLDVQKKRLHIVNLDFHADDGLCSDLEQINCGNWLSALRIFKENTVDVSWYQIHSKGDHRRPLNKHEDIKINKYKYSDDIWMRKYDMVFICQSWEFSPPHVNHRFRELIGACKKPVISENDPPLYPVYTDEVKRILGTPKVYTLEEADNLSDDVIDDEDTCIVDTTIGVLETLPDCDPQYKR